MGNLTDIALRAWIKTGQPVAKADSGGLTFTMSAHQASQKGGTWVLRYRFGGKPRELTLGRYPDITLAVARQLAAEARVRISQGADPAREKQLSRIERAGAKDFRALASDYMEKAFPRLADTTVKQRRQHIEGVILPKLGSLPAREVTGADVVALIESVGAKSVNVAELVFTALSEIFKHGIARRVVVANPCAGISVSAICGRPDPRRQRLMLTEAELRAIFPALPSIGRENMLAVKLLLVTCARVGELARAEWTHVDLPKGEWFIPDENSKTGKGFTVPLPPCAVGWFKELQELACGSRFVLPARQQRRLLTHGQETHFEQRALNAILHKLCDRLGDKSRRFTPHDLRSTARSHLAALGVPVLIAERCLNHSLGGLVAVYDQHDYLTERRGALELWASFLLACESGKEWIAPGGKVVPLRSHAA